MISFTAMLGGHTGERPVVILPFDAKERFGKVRAPVRGKVNGAAFRTTVAIYGGVQMLGFNKEVRSRAGIDIGDEVTVELELDDELRTVKVPPALERALARNAQARTAFEALSYSHRREYAEWVASAKREETHERRAAKAVQLLLSGARSP